MLVKLAMQARAWLQCSTPQTRLSVLLVTLLQQPLPLHFNVVSTTCSLCYTLHPKRCVVAQHGCLVVARRAHGVRDRAVCHQKVCKVRACRDRPSPPPNP